MEGVEGADSISNCAFNVNKGALQLYLFCDSLRLSFKKAGDDRESSALWIEVAVLSAMGAAVSFAS